MNHGRIDCSILIVMLTVLSVTGCATATFEPNRPGPEGQLAILGPNSSFKLDASPKDWPKDWIVSTDNSSGRAALSKVVLEGVPAVELRSMDTVTVAVRHVDAMLLATPFLSWSWNLSDYGSGIHPVRLVVGFQGGVINGAEDPLGGGLPSHDRALALVWGDTMLRRGTLSLPPADHPDESPLYTVRGGRENTKRWWLETVDLSQLYASAWPNDNFAQVRITFIGIAAAPKIPPVRGRVSGILLSH
jgi:hypothetical protein